jgi:CNT family concentrative nucleoside transporter
MLQLQSAFGVLVLLALTWACGENRRAVSLRQAAIGLVVTFVTAVVLIKLPIVAHACGAINNAVGVISAASRAGTSFVFGYLGGGTLPFDLKAPGADFILAFQALPIVLVMSVLTTLLFYWRILPPVVRGMAWLLERTLGVGGAVGLSTAANIFLGMVEAPLFIRPYMVQLTLGHAGRLPDGRDRGGDYVESFRIRHDLRPSFRGALLREPGTMAVNC